MVTATRPSMKRMSMSVNLKPNTAHTPHHNWYPNANTNMAITPMAVSSNSESLKTNPWFLKVMMTVNPKMLPNRHTRKRTMVVLLSKASWKSRISTCAFLLMIFL